MANLAYGQLTKHFVKVQSTHDTVAAFAATDAISPIAGSFKLEPTKSYEKSKEAAGTASLQTEIAGRRGGKWNLQAYVKPNTAGTAPDVGPLLQAGLGVETTGADVAYTLSDTVTTSLQLMQQAGTNLQQIASGAWVEQISIEANQSDPPMLSFSGGYARHGQLASCVTGAVVAGGATSVTLDAEDEGCIIPPCQLSVGQYDNSDAGYLASEYDFTTNALTVAALPAVYAKVYDDSAAAYYDLGDTSADDFVQWQVFPNNTQNADYLLLGFAEFPAKFHVDMGATAQTYTGDGTTWTYWDGAEWSALTITDGTGGATTTGVRSFQQDGTITVTNPGDAATSTLDGQSAYWIKVSPTAANISQVGKTNAKIQNLLPVGETIAAASPAPTVAGNILGPGSHSLTLFGETLGFVSAKINISTGVQGLDLEATTDRVNRLTRGERVVEGELQFYFLDGTDGNARVLGRAWNGTTGAILLRLGPNTANYKCTISIPAARFEVTAWDVPASGQVGATAKFVARQSAAANDEITITFA